MNTDAGRRREKSSTRTTGRGAQGKALRMFENHGNTLVLMTIASVLVATILGIGFISPILFTAAVFPFFYIAITRNDHRAGIVIVFRWSAVLFVTLLIVGIFVPDRLGASLPLSTGAVHTVETWIRDPGATPPANLNYIMWGMLAFAVATIVSGGLLGFFMGSVALGGAAYAALHVFRHGLNIVQISLVALPVWQLSLFIAGAFVLVPLSVFVFERFFNVERRAEDWELLRNFMYVSAGFFILSAVLRYATASVWRELVSRWTVF